MSELRMDDLVETFIKIREKKAKLKAEYTAKVAEFDAVADKIEAALLARFQEMGVDSVKTPSGTAYASARSSASVADWDSFKAFCLLQEDPLGYVERRVSKEAVEQFKAENEDLPPGVNWSVTRVINFRRS